MKITSCSANNFYIRQEAKVRPTPFKPAEQISFHGLKTNHKAIILSLITLISGGNFNSLPSINFSRLLGNKKQLTSFEFNKMKLPKGNLLFADELHANLIPENIVPNLCEDDFPSLLRKLSQESYAEKSYYYIPAEEKGKPAAYIFAKKLKDYTDLLNDVPESIAKNGSEAILKYKSSVISILQNCGEYGAMYIKNIPDKENILVHASGLKRLTDASVKIQGCKFQNAALFNGLTADELIKKVVIPNEKIANGESIDQAKKVLIFITNEFGKDVGNAFEFNYKSNAFTQRLFKIQDRKIKYDESFLGHYDIIIPMQPDKMDADIVLNNGFKVIAGVLPPSTNVDIAYMAHSTSAGAILSEVYKPVGFKIPGNMDINDFRSLKNGGEPYAQIMMSLLKPDSRLIGLGCYSEGFFNALPVQCKKFGTPYSSTGGYYSLGFNDGKLSLAGSTEKFHGDKNLLYRIRETDKTPESVSIVESFSIDTSLAGANIKPDAGQQQKLNTELDKKLLDEILSGKPTAKVNGERYFSAVAKKLGNGYMVMDYDIR